MQQRDTNTADKAQFEKLWEQYNKPTPCPTCHTCPTCGRVTYPNVPFYPQPHYPANPQWTCSAEVKGAEITD